VALYRPVAHEFEAPRTAPGGGANEGQAKGGESYLSRNIGDILHSVYRAARLKELHEAARGFKYDLVVKARFDLFIGQLPSLGDLSKPPLILTEDATRLLQSAGDSKSPRLLSVRRATVTMGREDVLQVCDSPSHSAVAGMSLNLTALLRDAKSSHVVQLMRRHLVNRGLLGAVRSCLGITHGLMRGPQIVDDRRLTPARRPDNRRLDGEVDRPNLEGALSSAVETQRGGTRSPGHSPDL